MQEDFAYLSQVLPKLKPHSIWVKRNPHMYLWVLYIALTKGLRIGEGVRQHKCIVSQSWKSKIKFLKPKGQNLVSVSLLSLEVVVFFMSLHIFFLCVYLCPNLPFLYKDINSIELILVASFCLTYPCKDCLQIMPHS